MALEAPLRSSTGSIISAFSSHSDMSLSSPDSPALHPQFRPMSASSVESSSLRPASAAARPASASNHLLSPSDIVGPSPVTSVGTEVTEIDDEVSDEARSESTAAKPEPHAQLLMLRTNISEQVKRMASDEAVSVIHAPESFRSWTSSDPLLKQGNSSQRSPPHTPPKPEDKTVPRSGDRMSKANSTGLPTPPPLATNVRPVRYSLDSATPRAQNLQDVQSLLSDSARIRSSSSSSLELIPESKEPETDVDPDLESYDEEYVTPVRGDEQEPTEVEKLESALHECWTLCNTLASLSTLHRERVFSVSGTPDGHEKAWKCCWKLCQRLYNNRTAMDESFNAKINLDLCRDFCQALFDVRQRMDDVSDSVLRVSFELNNHLYSAQDSRNLPEAFRERTLDFYITLCHRLMKQRGEVADETDSLLRACWSLAEMLFSLRQNRKDGKGSDEELLGSAIQSCWELCDIFREGWKQVRPDRGTPRPSQTNFFTYNREADQDGRASRQSNRSKRDSLKLDKPRKPLPVPETPVTEFEDTPLSPDDSDSPQVPNILVLGTDSSRGGRWSSSASNLSTYSQSSQRTSSTATTTTSAEDINISRIKTLILKAAMNVGYSRDGTDGRSGAVSLQSFVKSLPTGSFGSLPAHSTLLQSYKNLIGADSSFRQASTLPARGKRVTATDVAKSVGWMTHRSSQYGFLRDLFKLVFGFSIEEADSRKNVSIAV
ncbi:hypothetical protein F4778DRAFT_655564 [Xylariomycetidae sp. FL2044]|nr:hypothetical protein F4778DRAFT_655564 [Xylariomycetidae sp. FL2044]